MDSRPAGSCCPLGESLFTDREGVVYYGMSLSGVLSHYDLGALREVAPGGGTAGKAWIVTAGRGRFFVRRRGPRTSGAARLRFDHGLRAHLAAAGFPAHPALPADTGEPWLRTHEGVFEVYPLVAGRPFLHGRDDPAPIARCLAELHRIAAGYPGETEPVVPQFAGSPFTQASSPRFDDPQILLAVVDGFIACRGTPETRPALLAARDRVARLADDYGPAAYSRLPLWVVHGDFNCCNLLVDDAGAVTGVFDFDWATRAPRTFDLAEAAFFFATRRASPPDGGSIWSLTACPPLAGGEMDAFVAAYKAALPPTADERGSWPLALLARWVAWRTEGIPKVPAQRQVEFFLQDFHRPFEWLAARQPPG